MSHQSSPPPHDLPERRRGGLVGLLVGDALGVPYEFTPAAGVPQRSAIEMTPPPGFARAHGRVEPGTWSDDGAQALVLLDSLLRLGRLDADDLADGIRRWYREGFCAVGGVVFDVGIQTSAAIRRHESGTPAPQAGPAGERDNGNGSLMRVLPLALWHTGSDAGLVAPVTEARTTQTASAATSTAAAPREKLPPSPTSSSTSPTTSPSPSPSPSPAPPPPPAPAAPAPAPPAPAPAPAPANVQAAGPPAENPYRAPAPGPPANQAPAPDIAVPLMPLRPQPHIQPKNVSIG